MRVLPYLKVHFIYHVHYTALFVSHFQRWCGKNLAHPFLPPLLFNSVYLEHRSVFF